MYVQYLAIASTDELSALTSNIYLKSNISYLATYHVCLRSVQSNTSVLYQAHVRPHTIAPISVRTALRLRPYIHKFPHISTQWTQCSGALRVICSLFNCQMCWLVYVRTSHFLFFDILSVGWYKSKREMKKFERKGVLQTVIECTIKKFTIDIVLSFPKPMVRQDSCSLAFSQPTGSLTLFCHDYTRVITTETLRNGSQNNSQVTATGLYRRFTNQSRFRKQTVFYVGNQSH